MKKSIEIVIEENNDITINTYDVETGAMVRILTAIILQHARGNYKLNVIKSDNE
jgi:hypothetical protein